MMARVLLSLSLALVSLSTARAETLTCREVVVLVDQEMPEAEVVRLIATSERLAPGLEACLRDKAAPPRILAAVQARRAGASTSLVRRVFVVDDGDPDFEESVGAVLGRDVVGMAPGDALFVVLHDDDIDGLPDWWYNRRDAIADAMRRGLPRGSAAVQARSALGAPGGEAYLDDPLSPEAEAFLFRVGFRRMLVLRRRTLEGTNDVAVRYEVRTLGEAVEPATAEIIFRHRPGLGSLQEVTGGVAPELPGIRQVSVPRGPVDEGDAITVRVVATDPVSGAALPADASRWRVQGHEHTVDVAANGEVILHLDAAHDGGGRMAFDVGLRAYADVWVRERIEVEVTSKEELAARASALAKRTRRKQRLAKRSRLRMNGGFFGLSAGMSGTWAPARGGEFVVDGLSERAAAFSDVSVSTDEVIGGAGGLAGDIGLQLRYAVVRVEATFRVGALVPARSFDAMGEAGAVAAETTSRIEGGGALGFGFGVRPIGVYAGWRVAVGGMRAKAVATGDDPGEYAMFARALGHGPQLFVDLFGDTYDRGGDGPPVGLGLWLFYPVGGTVQELAGGLRLHVVFKL